MGSSTVPGDSSLLSRLATGNGHGEDLPYFDGWKAYDSDPYHPTLNPGGVIQMGLSENLLSLDLIVDWIKKNPSASICTPQGVSEFKDIAIFQDYHGLPAFRNAMANFMERVRGGRVKFDPNRIVMGGGATGANELVAFCLADPGDAFLVPSPCYPVFNRDLRWRTGIQLIPIACDSSNNFALTIPALEAAYNKAKESNIRVKGLVITNPSNPLGTVMDRDTLRSLATFVTQKNIHLVCDEIYASTVFSEPKFTSISEIIGEDIDCNLDLIHVVYSLSKDFGLPGFRVGVIYSYNDAVVRCARRMSSFGLVSTQTQHLIARMLADGEFMDAFRAESARRLAARHGLFTGGLAQVGIGCLKSSAGLFCWMDLRALLAEPTVEAEMALWRTIIDKVKLNVSPGSSFNCPEPGWFRACFANMDDETTELALHRIRSFMAHKAAPPAKNRRWQANLRLSFSSMRSRYDDILSPSTMSPHSPMLRASS